MLQCQELVIDQNSSVMILLIIPNHQSFFNFSGVLMDAYNRHSVFLSVGEFCRNEPEAHAYSHLFPYPLLSVHGSVHITIFWLARHHKNATRALIVDIFLWGSLITTENVTNPDCH